MEFMAEQLSIPQRRENGDAVGPRLHRRGARLVEIGFGFAIRRRQVQVHVGCGVRRLRGGCRCTCGARTTSGAKHNSWRKLFFWCSIISVGGCVGVVVELREWFWRASCAACSKRRHERFLPCWCGTGVSGPCAGKLKICEVEQRNECLSAVRKRCAKTLHFASLVPSNKFGNQAAEVVDAGTLAFAEMFDKGKTTCKTRVGGLHWHQDLAAGGVLNTISDAFAYMGYPEIVDRVDFLPSEEFDVQTAGAILQDNLLAQVWFDLVVSLSWRYATSTMTYSAVYPMKFILLIMAGEEKKKELLAEYKADWELLCRMERMALDDQWVAGFLRSLRWPQEQFVREIMVQLAEESFCVVTDEVHARVRGLAYAFKSTNIVEDLHNKYRFAEGASSNGSFGRIARWHRSSTCRLLTEYDCKAIAVTDEARALRAPAVVAKDFKPAVAEFSMDAEEFQKFDEPTAFHRFHQRA